MKTTVDVYRMNPEADTIVFGDELAEGMWVIHECPEARCARNAPEEVQLRGQRFRRVTRLRTESDVSYAGGAYTVFVGEWVDGYQEVHEATIRTAWIVKRDATETTGDQA
jgi:hypothetical protein